jgi:Cft2 family RNA processing exonuclease
VLTAIHGPRGIHIPEIDLWLDPQETVETAWISHAHSDHARGRHASVIATPETLALYRVRWPEDPEVPQALTPLDYGKSLSLRGATLTALPAGHILGAAQILIEHRGYRLLYTGDFKLMPPLCGRTAETARCHHVIMESTFGLPIYQFLRAEAAREAIVRFAEEALDEKALPVFFGYPLGRGQEIAHVLCTAGVPTAIHGAMVKFLPHYESAGYGFPGWQPYEAASKQPRALVVPAGMRNILEASGARSGTEVRIAYVSGWARLANARARAGAHELIPYSDHASFPELLDFAAACQPERIDVVHGYADPFARILRDRGYQASAASAARGETED